MAGKRQTKTFSYRLRKLLRGKERRRKHFYNYNVI